jgi:hypothetical protein
LVIVEAVSAAAGEVADEHRMCVRAPAAGKRAALAIQQQFPVDTVTVGQDRVLLDVRGAGVVLSLPQATSATASRAGVTATQRRFASMPT